MAIDRLVGMLRGFRGDTNNNGPWAMGHEYEMQAKQTTCCCISAGVHTYIR